MARGRGNTGPRVPGVVLEVSGRRAVVLAEGRFLRVRAMPGWEPGEEIWIAPPQGAAATPVRRRVAAALATCVALGAGGGLWAGVASAQAVAVVSVDINPSLQMSIDVRGRVIQVTAMDDDGRRLLDEVALLHLPVQQAVASVVDRAVADGYLSHDANADGSGVVFVAAAPLGQGQPALPPDVVAGVQQAQAQVQAVLEQHHLAATVAVTQAPKADAQHAEALGMTLGQYELYQNVKASGVPTDPTAWRHRPVGQNLAGAGVPSSDVAAVVAAVAKGTEPEKVIQAARQGLSRTALERIAQASSPASPVSAASQDQGRGNGEGGGSDGGNGKGTNRANGNGNGERDHGGGNGRADGHASGNGNGGDSGTGTGKGNGHGEIATSASGHAGLPGPPPPAPVSSGVAELVHRLEQVFGAHAPVAQDSDEKRGSKRSGGAGAGRQDPSPSAGPGESRRQERAASGNQNAPGRSLSPGFPGGVGAPDQPATGPSRGAGESDQQGPSAHGGD